MAASQASLYDQKEKNECRSRLIEHAITCLTTKRDTSVCVTPNHVLNTWTNVMKTREAFRHFSLLERLRITKAIEKLKEFHETRIQTKTPKDLRVCYLAGDDPTNDLKVFLDNGILAQNIWAIEKDVAVIAKALKTVCQPESKHFKLFKGDLMNFLKEMKEQFDIIYYDACGSLPSAKQGTLKVIGTVFLHNKLTSPGALITNFSFPPAQAPEQDKEMKETNMIKSLAETYLKYRELNTPSFQDLSEKNKRTAEDTYSDYITFQVIDSAAVYIPSLKMLLSQALWNQLYSNRSNFLEKVKLYDTGEEYSQTFNECSYFRKIGSDMKKNAPENRLCKSWVNEIFPDWKTSCLQKEEISSLFVTHHLSCSEEFICKFANKDFQERCLKLLRQTLDTNDDMPPSFSDTLDADSATHLVGGIHYGQLAKPSFPVVDKLLRLRYTARSASQSGNSKKRRMFSDVFIFDKCPYLYDQFPSVDFGFDSIMSEQQMLIKMIVNGLRSHLREIYYDQFCSIADLHLTSLQIPQRENVRVDESPDLLHEAEADLQDAL